MAQGSSTVKSAIERQRQVPGFGGTHIPGGGGYALAGQPPKSYLEALRGSSPVQGNRDEVRTPVLAQSSTITSDMNSAPPAAQDPPPADAPEEDDQEDTTTS